jgi:myo-inositol-1(or 4)-monophosphatase
LPAPDRRLVEAIEAACAEAGALALSRANDGFRRWEKSAGSPVCEIDLEVDALLFDRLMAIDPDAGWLSEETADNSARLARRRVWVVDPIDGTRDYLRGRAGWCVSVALIEEGSPVVGVLDAPMRGERWTAARGAGAMRNGKAVRAGQRSALPGSRVPADTLPKVDTDLTAVPGPNSIALRLAMVAADEVDLCASLRWGNEWDIPAAQLIVEESGGIVTDALGQPIRYNKPEPILLGVLAAGANLHAAAVDRLRGRAELASRSPR